MKETKGLREGAMMTALTAVLILLCRYVPILSLFGTFICSLPMAALSARNGFKVLIPSVIAVFVMSIFIDGNAISAAMTLFMSVIPGVVAGYMLGRKKPFYIALFGTCLAVCVGWIFEILMLEMFLDSGIDKILDETMKQLQTVMNTMIKSLGEDMPKNEQLNPTKLAAVMLETAEMTIRLYFPAFVVIAAMITGYIILRLSGFLIRRARLANVETLTFAMLKAPRNMSLVAIVCYIAFIFIDPKARLMPVFANVVMILYTIIGVCGLSVLDFKLQTKISAAPLRFLIYAAVFVFGGVFMSIISSVLIIIGILDGSRDFRCIEVGSHNDCE